MAIRVGHIRGKEHLAAFFKAKNHKNLVLNLGDVLRLPEHHVQGAADFAARLDIGGCAERRGTMKPHDLLRFAAPGGYLIMPFEQLCGDGFDQSDLVGLQALTGAYKEYRRRDGGPYKEVPCKCGGRLSGCQYCAGIGHTSVLVEMSEEEIKLAIG